MSSFVETTAIYLTQDKPTEFVNYNKRQFSRIYPKGTRISSENFLPQVRGNSTLSYTTSELISKIKKRLSGTSAVNLWLLIFKHLVCF